MIGDGEPSCSRILRAVGAVEGCMDIDSLHAARSGLGAHEAIPGSQGSREHDRLGGWEHPGQVVGHEQTALSPAEARQHLAPRGHLSVHACVGSRHGIVVPRGVMQPRYRALLFGFPCRSHADDGFDS